MLNGVFENTELSKTGIGGNNIPTFADIAFVSSLHNGVYEGNEAEKSFEMLNSLSEFTESRFFPNFNGLNNTQVNNIQVNGNTIYAFNNGQLVYSKNYGESWK